MIDPTACSTLIYPTMNIEMAGLPGHLHACKRAQGRSFGLQCMGERLHAMLAPRLITTFALVAALLGVLSAYA